MAVSSVNCEYGTEVVDECILTKPTVKCSPMRVIRNEMT